MATFRLDTLYFDGLGGAITYDQAGAYHDTVGPLGVEVTPEIALESYREILRERNLGFTIESEFRATLEYSQAIDLMRLIPLKFRSSVLLQQYIDAVDLYVGAWLANIKNMGELLDPYRVGADYIQYLADSIGLTLYRTDTSTETELRRQIQFAIELYKRKGTYGALKYISYLCGLNIDIWDFYCDSESNYNAGIFSRQGWWAGGENENPPGLSSSYFKTPHIGLEVVLNKVYNEGSSTGAYLWDEDLYTPFATQIEIIRPVNVVPHYMISLTPQTYEDGQILEVAGNIQTKVLNWTYTAIYFDSGVSFDAGKYFDSSYDAFLNDITKWKLGNGNKGGVPGTDITNVVLSGNITTATKYLDRNTFEFTIPSATVQEGISELGLYLSNNTTPVCLATFPNIEKHSGVELRILVEIFK